MNLDKEIINLINTGYNFIPDYFLINNTKGFWPGE